MDEFGSNGNFKGKRDTFGSAPRFPLIPKFPWDEGKGPGALGASQGFPQFPGMGAGLGNPPKVSCSHQNSQNFPLCQSYPVFSEPSQNSGG